MESPPPTEPPEDPRDRRASADLLLVLAVYLVPSIYGAFESWFHQVPPLPLALGEVNMAVRAVGFLALGFYLILRSGETASAFGLVRPRVSDLFVGLGVWVGLFLLSLGVGWLLGDDLFGLPVRPPADFYRAPRTALDYLMVAVGSVLNGFGEEVVMRGVVQTHLRRLLRSPAGAVVLTAVLFGLYHAYYGVGGAIDCLLIGLALGAVVQLSGRLWPAAVAHAAQDFMAMVWLAAAS